MIRSNWRRLHLLMGLGVAACAAESRFEASTQPEQSRAAVTTGQPIAYSYDAAGRLAAVTDPNGNSAQYIYDAVGNILQVVRVAAATPAIFTFLPSGGPVGATVTVSGSGFSATPANNQVKFNGTAATVTSATARQLVVTVPAGATSGPLQVTVGANVATSAASFAVGPIGPSISNFSPQVGNGSTVLTVTGARFRPALPDNAVLVGGQATGIATATATQITAVVGPPGRSGYVTVTTSQGSATSSQPFYILPTGIAANAVGFKGVATVNGPALNITVPGGKVGLVFFAGDTNDRLSTGFTAVTLGGAATGNFSLNDLQGAFMDTVDFYGDRSYTISPLPTTGNYVAVVTPGSGATQLTTTLYLSRPVTGTITSGGSNVTFTGSRPGQAGKYTFVATAGQSLSLALQNATFPTGIDVTVTGSDGTVAGAVGVFPWQNSTIPLRNLTAQAYSIDLNTPDASTGQVTLKLNPYTTGSAGTVNGNATSLSLQAGRYGLFTFSGTGGSFIGLGLPTFSTTPAWAYVSIQVLNPDGSTLVDCSTAAPTSCRLPVLPATGTYALNLEPLNGEAVSLQTLLSSALTGTLTAGGAAKVHTTNRVGRGGRYTFVATSGQNRTLTATGSTFASGMQVEVLDPGGVQVTTFDVFSSSPVSAPLTGLVAGTYTVVLTPYDVSVGTISLSLN